MSTTPNGDRPKFGRPIAVTYAIEESLPLVGRPPGHDVDEQTSRFEQLKLCTVASAAEFLAVSENTVYELCRKGTLRSISIGSARRVPRAALIEYVETELELRDVTDERYGTKDG